MEFYEYILYWIDYQQQQSQENHALQPSQSTSSQQQTVNQEELKQPFRQKVLKFYFQHGKNI